MIYLFVDTQFYLSWDIKNELTSTCISFLKVYLKYKLQVVKNFSQVYSPFIKQYNYNISKHFQYIAHSTSQKSLFEWKIDNKKITKMSLGK